MGRLKTVLKQAENALDMSQRARMQRAREMGMSERGFHGTGADVDEFSGITWISETPDLANDYAAMRHETGGAGRVMELMANPGTTLDANAISRAALTSGAGVKIGSFMNDVLSQARQRGREFSDSEMEALKGHLATLRAAGRREESGPVYSPHQFWNYPAMSFGDDGAAAIDAILDIAGFDSIRVTENGANTLGVRNPARIRSVNATFDPSRSDSSNLLAGVGGAAVGAGLFLPPQTAEAQELDAQIQAMAPTDDEEQGMGRIMGEVRELNRRRMEQLSLDPMARDPQLMASIEGRIATLRDDPLVENIRERQKKAVELAAEYRAVSGQDYGAEPYSPERRMANIASDTAGRFSARRELPRSTAIENYANLIRTLPMTPWASWENGLAAASAMAGEIFGGLTMLGVAPIQGLEAAVEAGEGVTEAMQYQPRTEAGQELQGAVGGLMQMGVDSAMDTDVGRAVAPFGDYYTDRVVPALQDELGVDVGSAVGAGIKALPNVL